MNRGHAASQILNQDGTALSLRSMGNLASSLLAGPAYQVAGAVRLGAVVVGAWRICIGNG